MAAPTAALSPRAVAVWLAGASFGALGGVGTSRRLGRGEAHVRWQESDILWVTNDALQIFGAMGYSRNLALERKVLDARMFPIAGGTAQIPRTQVAGSILGIRTPQSRDGYLKARAGD